MTQRVQTQDEVIIGTTRFPLGGDGRVRSIVASQYPQKVVFGDVDKDSNPRTSLVVWDDWSGGIGLYATDGKEGMDRFEDSNCETRYKGHLTLAVLETVAADPSVAGTMDEINELAAVIYAALNGGTDAYSWTPSSDTWSAKLHDFPAQVTDSLNFTLGGTEYLAFAHTGGYTYTSDGSSWTDDTTDTLHLAFWDDRLWGIDNAGQLWFATAIGTEVNDAQLALPAGYVNGLFTGPDGEGNEILYASTEVGLYAHDAANSRFVRTGVTFPQNSEAGKGAATWNSEIYIVPGGNTVFRYDPRSGIVRSVGLDRDGGLQSNEIDGNITRLVPVHTGLLAVISDSTAKAVYEYNGRGWHYMIGDASNITGVHASDAGGNYRVYFAHDDRLRHRPLFVGFVNPDIETINYNTLLSHRTPWFNAGQNDVDKVAIRVRIDCDGMSADETILVRFALDYSTSNEASTYTITSNGVTTLTFPTIANNNAEAGSSFRAIRFDIRMERGATTTKSPNMKSLSLEWRRKIPARYGFQFDINRDVSYGGRSPKELKAALITAIESSTPQEFTFVSDDGNTQNYFVDISQMEDIQETGHGEAGATRVAVFEN